MEECAHELLSVNLCSRLRLDLRTTLGTTLSPGGAEKAQRPQMLAKNIAVTMLLALATLACMFF